MCFLYMTSFLLLYTFCREVQQQNSLYPKMRSPIQMMTPHTRLGSSIIRNIPKAIQNRANPITLFISLTSDRLLTSIL